MVLLGWFGGRDMRRLCVKAGDLPARPGRRPDGP